MYKQDHYFRPQRGAKGGRGLLQEKVEIKASSKKFPAPNTPKQRNSGCVWAFSPCQAQYGPLYSMRCTLQHTSIIVAACVTPTPTLTHHPSASFKCLTLSANLNTFLFTCSPASFPGIPILFTPNNRLKMAFYVSPGPLCDACKFCTIPQRVVYHSGHFKAVSVSPVNGIIFKAYEYSATQLADAFEKLIPGHMDFEIKRLALIRWDELLSELLNGPLWRETEFDLKDSFPVLDDFLFLRALQNRCRVEWVDECQIGWKRGCVGWCECAEETNRGPTQWIRIVRPTVKKPRTVEDVLCTLMHETCHAIFAFRCDCSCCRCLLNRINCEGLTGHGPSWKKLRQSIEQTASLHLKGFSESIRLCYPNEPEAEAEEKKVAKKLSGLYKKITQQGSRSAELKRLEREMEWDEETKLFAKSGKEKTEDRYLETLTCADAVLADFERKRVLAETETRSVYPP